MWQLLVYRALLARQIHVLGQSRQSEMIMVMDAIRKQNYWWSVSVVKFHST